MERGRYSIIFARSASKELESLEPKVIARVLPRVKALSENPRPSGCKKLAGGVDAWRIRIGDYRVIYRVDDTVSLVTVMVVRHRSKAYE
ncbi:MAG TPA: type II toxin-antitoxin system RelE/ParE family toxin [Thermoanaerobaculales bacterium]|nr:type II toxin-antitoxin system RelE/ParE family toxin [Thermoanaerobaculales bacterium]HPA82343.1 type II toxin-antitoxin system RelE/ParE family toxin [Thermoanaerobaculales bacterium]HQL28594.1 type II toxin-antitoxin system RelE/ParE family toxin [Thermoanaerobaculales bacterium]HQN95772.1 type II toxin-antitoxin system RelE/ParE family toxin [Thermoanaerobaculales bacterium]HQP44520.1 type II toxin-antitoxin system RelE/ParE family toxin [Thermoanaerobaculales bacterium]